MRMILALTVGALLVAGSARADPTTFTALEAQLSDALANYDAPAIDKMWDDDLVFVFPNGKLSRKAERLAAQVPPPDTGGPKLVAKNDAVDVEYEDSHMAVVLVRSTWRFGDEPPQHFVATHVWISRPQGWRLLSAQVAQLKDKP
ncbi:MAG TPA: nuclear transport factor 2 family protein [Caulobacteraceae bacterium]|nr:nuclear transport factor 2 family protein [Caulobacteraceae bacterium]